MENHNLEIEKWIKKRQETAKSRERSLKQFEEKERLAEKQSRASIIVLTKTVRQLLR